LGGKERQSGKPPKGESTKEKTIGDKGPIDEKGDPAKTPKRPQYDPNSPIYQLMNNPALYDPIRRPRNPIVLAHGTLAHSSRLAGDGKF
jgi:triacylglycerol lipase